MTLLLVSTADTDLMAARASGAGWRVANPARGADVPALLDGVSVAVVRLLGGRSAWPDGLDALLRSGVPTVVLAGDAVPDPQLMAASTVPSAVVAETLAYLSAGGPGNLAELAAFLSDTLLFTGLGFAAPTPAPQWGIYRDAASDAPDGRPDSALGPVVGVVFYRAHALAGNTGFVDALCEAITARGGRPLAVWCPSLRQPDPELLATLGRASALIVTVLAAGGTTATDATAAGDPDAWDVGALAALDVPVVQGLCLTSSRAQWESSAAGMSPLDAAMQVAIPEFDGRIVSVPFSFKEDGPDGVARYTADPERARRVAGLAVRLGRLRSVPAAQKKVALVLSSYPTKHARIGNAVGLDTPASALALLHRMADAGYTVGELPPDGDTLIHTLIAAGGHDVSWLTESQLAAAPARMALRRYAAGFDALDPELTGSMRTAWGDPPGELYVDDSGPEPQIVLATLQFGNVVLMIQPPRGFGENPVAIYHDPDLAPSHHYLAAYRWLAEDFGADAVVHLGKHGTLEWLPGKGLGLSAGCAPDAVLGELPLIYPFLVNDPGEGTQAKRRAHAVVVDHLIPPMARADTYGDMARLEQLLDEHALVAAMDPDKLPELRAQIWELITAAQLHADLHIDARPADEDFDDFLLHVDGYLCEIKDVLVRDGLHILGAVPTGAALESLVLAVLRAAQVFGGRRSLPGLRGALGAAYGVEEQRLLDDAGAAVTLRPRADLPGLADLAPAGAAPARSGADVLDLLEQRAARLVAALAATGWDPDAAEAITVAECGVLIGDVVESLRFAAEELVPRLARTGDELGNVLGALEGRHVPAGPSGSPTRGLVGVLPTGRNFYSVDPKAVPSASAWKVGWALAESLLARYRRDTGDWPRSVGLTVWGTSAMRTQGDDIAEILALLGVRPTWDAASRRVTGLQVIPAEELGRPRVDVTVRISGFFRDAFPHVVALLDEAVRLVADLDEADNRVREHALADAAAGGDWRRATTRIFGSKPGAYGAGLLPLIDARNWRDDADLAEVYATWGGYAYGAGLDGRPARAELETAYRRIEVAAKNQDTREHDLVDSDDYFQYHGGMVAMVRALTGADPAAYIGDSAVPDAVRTRTLGEETARVFRARVVNPRWIAAMRRHGYKGAFELAATVDYLFGYDATAGVVADWMYEALTASYVTDPVTREFLTASNPWALSGIAERLLEAAERGLWAAPEPQSLAALRDTVLEMEGRLEGGPGA